MTKGELTAKCPHRYQEWLGEKEKILTFVNVKDTLSTFLLGNHKKKTLSWRKEYLVLFG